MKKTSAPATKSRFTVKPKPRAEAMDRDEAVESTAKANEAKRVQQHASLLPRWLAGEDVILPDIDTHVRLRAIGDRVQTTTGQEVTLNGVRKLLPFLQQKRKVGWRPKPGEPARKLDLHPLNGIDAGGVVIGCTRIVWSEVDRFAATLKKEVAA